MSTSPIKRNKNLISLSRDHHDGLMMVWKIRQGVCLGVNSNRISDYVIHAFESELEPHFREEEKLLFVKLNSNEPLRKQAEEEHELLRKLFNQIKDESLPSIPLLEKFAATLEAHIRFEERQLFPYLEEVVADNDLVSIGERLSKKEGRTECPVWHDEFWINKQKNR